MSVARNIVTNAFPRDVVVYVVNRNPFNVELMWDSEPYEFPATHLPDASGKLVPNPEAKAVPIAPEVAYSLFLLETRTDRPYRDRTSGQTHTQHPYYVQRLIAMGWANDPELREAFEKFEFRVHKGRHMAVSSFEKLPQIAAT